MGNRLEFRQGLDRMDVTELAREAQRLAREIEEGETGSEALIEELELVQRAMSVRRAPTAGHRAEQREMALTADGCLDVGLNGDAPTDDEECLLGTMRALGILPGEAIRLLTGARRGTAGPGRPRDDDAEGDEGQGQEDEAREGDEGQEGEDDDQDQEQEDNGERDPGHSTRPLYRQVMTFTAPKDDVYAAESLSVEVLITHERMEGLALMRDLPEHDQAGWHWWGFGNFEVGVRPVGD